MKIIDLANYTTVPSQSQLNLLKGFGLTRMIVGASFGQVARAQLQAGVAAGLEVEAYFWLSFGDTWKDTLDHGFTAIVGLPVQRVWLDLEETPSATPLQIIERIRDAVAYLQAKGLEVGLYTRAGWWMQYGIAAGDPEYTLPLFYAHYDGDPTCKWDEGEAFGEWPRARVIYKQYSGSTTEDGLNVDLDSICEEDMADYYNKAEVDAKVGALLGLGITHGQQIQAIGSALADHIQNHNDTSVSASTADIEKMLADLKQAEADLTARIQKAGEILNSPSS